jgi:hypothetical protein
MIERVKAAGIAEGRALEQEDSAKRWLSLEQLARSAWVSQRDREQRAQALEAAAAERSPYDCVYEPFSRADRVNIGDWLRVLAAKERSGE